MSDNIHVKNWKKNAYMTGLHMQCIHKKIKLFHQPPYTYSVSLHAQPYRIVIHPFRYVIWNMMYSEQKFNKLSDVKGSEKKLGNK